MKTRTVNGVKCEYRNVPGVGYRWIKIGKVDTPKPKKKKKTSTEDEPLKED